MLAPFHETNFGAQLRLLRRRAQLTQQELSLAVGYSYAQISRLETGRRPPDLPTLIALFCPALGLDPRSAEGQHFLALAASARPAPHAAVPSPPAPLPSPSSLLIGRTAERNLLHSLFTHHNARLVTLLGTAGVGKTRLAMHMAHELAPHFAHGTTLVELAAVNHAADVPTALAAALGIRQEGHETATAAVLAHLQPQHTLLILDNVEQIQGIGRLVADWLAAVPRLHLLVTSRIALRLTVEHTLPLGPLAVPPLAPLPPLEQLAQVEAMALLCARLRTATPDFALTAANALPLAAICVRVDGLPLAIELVAAHGRLFTPTELLTEIAQRFLQMGQRGDDVHARHRTATAALAWSYDQLPQHVQILLTRLSLFANGWSVAAATAVCDLEETGATAIQESLEILLDHSLLQRHTIGEETRLTMLTMVREFAQHHLDQRHTHEKMVLHGRLLTHLTTWAESADPFLVGGNQQGAWLARLEAEHDNLRHILRWAYAHAPAQGVRLTAALWRFWYMRGHLREGRQWAEQFLPHAANVPPATHAKLLDGMGILAWRQADYATADTWCSEALAIYQQIQHAEGEAQVLGHLGLIAATQGQSAVARQHYAASLPLYQAQENWVGAVSVLHNLGNLACEENDNTAAQAYYEQCVELYEERGNDSGLALVYLGLGVIAREAGEPTKAQALFEQSRALAQKVGDEWNVATADTNLGDLAAESGDWTAARLYLNRALVQFEEVGDQQSICIVTNRLADVALRAGEMGTAVRLFRQQLMLAHGLGYQPGLVEGWEGLARCAAEKQPALAVQLLACAGRVRQEVNRPLSPLEQLPYEAVLATTHATLPPAEWEQAWAKGGKMELGAAVALALTA